MKYVNLLIQTQKEEPRAADNKSIKLLERAGFVEKVAAGVYTYLPLGFKVLKRIEEVIRSNFTKSGIAELKMPILQPALPWRMSGRWSAIGDELWRIKNKSSEDFVLSFTAEELIVTLLKSRIRSYKDLPIILNQIQTKIRDEKRSRGGLLRLREFLMQDAYSFDQDKAGMEKSFIKIERIYQTIFDELELSVIEVEADPGNMGGSRSAEFMITSKAGEDQFVKCSKCSYAANIESAECLVEPVGQIVQKEQEIKEIHTPNVKSIEQLSLYLNEKPENMIKVVIYNVEGELVMVAVRGDLDINEKKLSEVLGKKFKIAQEAELDKIGVIAGFASPYGMSNKKLKILADRSVRLGGPYIVGANRRDRHIKGVKVSDLRVDQWVDIVGVTAGCHCPRCGGQLEILRGIELGHVFQLGTFYSRKMDFNYQDKQGKLKPVFMGSYGIGLDRLIGAIAEVKNDELGIVWPEVAAPFQIYLATLSNNKASLEAAEKIEKEFETSNIEVLLDDRDVTAGVKFADADLIGIPYRIVISKRTLAKESVELKKRIEAEPEGLIKLTETVDKMKKILV